MSSLEPFQDYHLYTMTGCCVCTKPNPCTEVHGIVSSANSVENGRTIVWKHAFCLQSAQTLQDAAQPYHFQKLKQAVNAVMKNAIAYLCPLPIALVTSTIFPACWELAYIHLPSSSSRSQ